jgi:dihydroorotate dehydrogenase (fumarate)
MTTSAAQTALTCSYLGLKLAHPFILGASPLTGHLDNVRRLEDGGCAAICMHSLFEEQVAEVMSGGFSNLKAVMPQTTGDGFRFHVPKKFPLEPDEYLEQIRNIKAAVSIPVIASLNGVGVDGWLTYATLMEQAGADALELNLYYLSTSQRDSSSQIEKHIAGLVRKLKAQIRIPLAVKLTPFYTSFAALAKRLETAGADGLVMFNRFYQPDIDVESLEVRSNLRLSTSAELLLRLHWVAILSDRIKTSLALSGGVHTVLDGVKALLCGAHAVQMVSAILQQGPRHFRDMERGLGHWMARHEYDSIEAFRGRLNLKHSTNMAYFERLSYLRILQTWPDAVEVQDPSVSNGV